MKKFFFIIFIFFLVFSTAIIKNSTKRIEDDIFAINENLRGLKKDFANLSDIWLFESRELKEVSYQAGFSSVRTLHWNLFHAFIANKFNLHLNHSKTRLSKKEILLAYSNPCPVSL